MSPLLFAIVVAALLLLCAVYLLAAIGQQCFGDWLKHCEEMEAKRLEWDQADDSPAYLLPGQRGPWTAEDAAATRKFFASPAGRRFTEQLNYAEGGIMSSAIHHEGDGAEYQRGKAAGYRALLRDITKLFSPSAESADTSPTQPPEQAGEA